MKSTQDNFARELRFAKLLYGDLPKTVLRALRELIQRHQVSVNNGDIKYLDGGWYVTHSGLLRLAERRRCAGIHCRPVLESSDPATSRWVFRAAVFKSRACRGFVGYGDADPSNVSALVHGAEMRVAETRAVNRALRKAYGIGICSVEEIGSFAEPPQSSAESKKLPPQPSQRKPRRPQGSRPPLPDHPPASTRSQLGQGLCHRLLRRQGACAMPPASRSKPSSRIWPTGPRKTAMPCSASSTAISARKSRRRDHDRS